MPELNLQWIGPVMTLLTFVTIGLGHVAVRKLHYEFGTRPIPAVAAVGLAVVLASTLVEEQTLSAVLGITGLTILWDALELFRQEQRARRGHAPVKPSRHHLYPQQRDDERNRREFNHDSTSH